MSRRTTDRTTEALSLYAEIRPFFGSQIDRARAIGISRNAIRPWDNAEITSVNESSLQRIRLVAQACRQLNETMSTDSVGTYLLGSCMVDRVIPRLDLIVQSGSADIIVDLVRAESEALARVAVQHLPPEAFEDEAWDDIIDALPAGERQLFDELLEKSPGSIPAVL